VDLVDMWWITGGLLVDLVDMWWIVVDMWWIVVDYWCICGFGMDYS